MVQGTGGRPSTAIVRHALQLMTPGRGFVAMLVPLAWDTAKSRRDLFMQPGYVAEVGLLDRMQVMEGTAVDKGLTSTIQATWHVWDLSRQRRSGIRKHLVTKSEANAEAGGPRRKRRHCGGTPRHEGSAL